MHLVPHPPLLRRHSQIPLSVGCRWRPFCVPANWPGVVYREVTGSKEWTVPGCETSLVWSAGAASPALLRFMAFAAS